MHFAASECTYVKYQIILIQPETKIIREEITSKHTTSLTAAFLLSVKRLKSDGPNYSVLYIIRLTSLINDSHLFLITFFIT